MALVSYDVSDASGSEDEDAGPPMVEERPQIRGKSMNAQTSVLQDDKDASITEGSALLSVLPTPKSTNTIIAADFSRLRLLNKSLSAAEKPIKKSVQIAIPALSELEEDLPRPIAKKITTSSKGSGLFAILPPPRHTGMAATLKLMPDSLKKTGPTPKPALAIPKKMASKSKPLSTPPMKSAPPVNPQDDDSDDETNDDFFSLSKPTDPGPVSVDTLLHGMVPEISVVPENPTADSHELIQSEVVPPSENSDYCETAEYVPFSSDSLELNDEAIQKLCGGGKRKRTALQAELIDVSEKDVVPNQSDWLLKTLTEEKRTRSHKKSSGPSNQQKRKHQITYLAYQAKEQEQELQNQWANNKMTKKQTQSKYGF